MTRSTFLQITYAADRVEGDAQGLKNYLSRQGIMVRYYSSPIQLASCIRISVGRPEHTDALVLALQNFSCP